MNDLTDTQKGWLRIPKSYWHVKTELIIDTQAKEFLINAVNGITTLVEKGAILSITGEPGVGKRSLATLILKNAFLFNGISGMYITAGELQDAIRQGEETREGELIQIKADMVGILVVSNFGQEHVAFGKNHVIDLVNKRHLENKFTVLVSNKTLPQLAKEKYSKEFFDDILRSFVSFEPKIPYCNMEKKEIEAILFRKEQECLPT